MISQTLRKHLVGTALFACFASAAVAAPRARTSAANRHSSPLPASLPRPWCLQPSRWQVKVVGNSKPSRHSPTVTVW